jgi:hypothetical protein
MGQNTSTNTSNDDNVDSFTAVWLDAEVNTNFENRKTEQKLRALINPLKTFDSKNPCEKYIRSVSSKEQILLIISGRLGRELVPQIHQLPQVISIYVYCKDKNANEKWAIHFPKVNIHIYYIFSS